MSKFIINRRKFLTIAGVAASAVPLSGCDAFDGFLSGQSPVRDFLASANGLTYRAHRMLIGADTLAPEFSTSEIRQGQRPNGSTDPVDADYLALKETAFAGYRLAVGGLVEKPVSFSLDELRNMPARTQITRHDCVEGWSCIAKWTGVQLSRVLDEAKVKPEARFVVFHCYDSMNLGLSGAVPYYESIDLIDARHPQTILAYGNNDQALPVANGAPLRVRIERQLGYKMAKYIKGIELVSTLAPFGSGKGGFWEDLGYEWYGGI
ncbi:molybdopterin oxidoreductase [Pararhizobium polonicum]|uniref:Molybdopterin oxidoreductase n=1 Tax=Pararhizobium polonicum TaxID=1612624 RepID=A0A1C7NTQ4_9HYPH|nr:molybdopterin-binding protein [Pararhizobium polonicum]OBZ92381.1 molybdopterin oxidoreductase [Pararhizobium polonicum]